MHFKDLMKISAIPVVIASLCCLSPVILVFLGLATVGFGASLADVFYGEYKWAFRGAGFLALMVAYTFYLRQQGICTLDQAKRQRNRILNGFLMLVILGIVGYTIFLYGVVEYLGIWLGLW